MHFLSYQKLGGVNRANIWRYRLRVLFIGLLVSSFCITANADTSLQFFSQRVKVKTPELDLYTVYAGDKNKPMVLLVHGLGQHGWLDWVNVFPELSQHYFVVALDLPAFGKSTKPQAKLDSELFARAVEATRAHYKNTQKMHLVGHSLGAAVAVKYASLFPDNVEKLVLVDAAGFVQRSVFIHHIMLEGLRPDEPLWSALYKRLSPELKRFSQDLTIGAESLPDITPFLLNNPLAREYLLADKTNLHAALGLIETNFSDDLNNIRAPTSVIWGGEDAVTSLRVGKILAHSIRNAQLHVIDGAGHVPMKTHTEAFNRLLVMELKEKAQHSSSQELITHKPVEPLVHCHNQKNFYFTGNVTRLVLERCENAVLENVQVTELELISSRVEIIGLTYQGKEPIVIDRSRIVLSNAKIISPLAMRVDDSRLDIANVEFYSPIGVWEGNSSTGFFSMSRRERLDKSFEILHDVFSL